MGSLDQATAYRFASTWRGPERLARRLRTHSSLFAEEMGEQAKDVACGFSTWWRGFSLGDQCLKVNNGVAQTHQRCHAGVAEFDEWFNVHYYRLAAQARNWRRQQREQGARAAGAAGAKSAASTARQAVDRAKRQTGRAFDPCAMLLLGAGAGSVAEGWLPLGLLCVWGVVRGARRFAVLKVDEGDSDGLFRLMPGLSADRRAEIFYQLQREIESFRALRRGDLRYADLSWIGKRGGQYGAMDPELDYTPESLFSDSMDSVAAHDRVREAIGDGVHPMAEPDKVVYRIHEGIAEVCLGWNVRGSTGTAEVQVKATACIVDFIYVFPAGHEGFVIRPHGNSSMDCSELPGDQKMPFGGDKSGRWLRNRSSIYEWDWTVKEFRHGTEDLTRNRWRMEQPPSPP